MASMTLPYGISSWRPKAHPDLRFLLLLSSVKSGVSPISGSAATGPRVRRIATLLFAFRQGFQFLVICYLGYLHCVQTFCPLLHNRGKAIAPVRVVVVDVAVRVDIPRVIRVATIR